MITLSPGLKNSLIVLEHLRDHAELCQHCDINVGAFTNGREVGLTFSVLGYFDDDGNNVVGALEDAFTYCVYEHRNSDEIILNGKAGYICYNGELPYQGDSKNDFIAHFSYKNHYDCALKLANLILKSRAKFMKSRNLETAVL